MSADRPTRVLLLGGSSEIGLAIVRRLAEDGPVRPYLLGRDEARLREAVSLLGSERYPGIQTGLLDAATPDSHERAVAEAFAAAGGFDLAVLAVGRARRAGRTGRRPGHRD